MDIKTLLREKSIRFPQKPAIIFKEKRLTFFELYKETLKLANGLFDLGFKKQDKLALFLPNGLEYVLGYLAGFSLGAVVVPLDSRLSQEEIISTLKHAECRFLIAGNLRHISLEAVKNEVPSLEYILSMDNLPQGSLNKEITTEINDADYSALFYTSGTTSKPKGVLWNYHHLDAAPMIMKHFVDLKETDIKLCCLPLSHVGGLVYLQNCIQYGITLVLMEHFIPDLFLENIARFRVTCMHLVPTIFTAVLASSKFETTDLSSLRWVDVFGAPNSLDILARFNKYCPQAYLLNGYGLTETAPPNTVSPAGKIDTVGKPPPWIEMSIFDEKDNPLAVGEVGEIVIRGWVVMEGYFKEPELTKEVMRQGWFHTGDLGRQDKEGYFYVVGRKKDMIKVGGLVVYPQEIEEVLAKHEAILESAVVGITDSLRGEKIKACVVLKDSNLKSEDIRSFCRKHLASFKVPEVIEIRDSLPKTTSGKIQKEALKC